MDTSLSGKLELLKLKIDTLVAQRDDSMRRLEASEAANRQLQNEINGLKESLHKSELDIEYLRLSHKMADNPQTLADARFTVQRMLKRVETAIGLLKEDAQL